MKKRTLLVGAPIIGAIGASFLFFSHPHTKKIIHEPLQKKDPEITLSQAVEEMSAPKKTADPQVAGLWFANPSLSWKKVTVLPGSSLFQIFKKQHIDLAIMRKILTLPDTKKYLVNLHPGLDLFFYKNTKTKQFAIKIALSDDKTFYVFSGKDGHYKTLFAQKPLSKQVAYRSATITDSFIRTARRNGLTLQQIHDLTKIFSGSINFARDIHHGDQFSLLYDEYYWNGKRKKIGDILAASFTIAGKTHTALRFSYPYNHTGYFTPDGSSVEPMFLSKPLLYKRISSKFSLHRYDPVLHILHPHLGVDFAAKNGTPIKSIGDGKIIFEGRKGGYGNAIVIRYNSQFKTLYGHLSRFASSLHVGSFVKKGQIVGYVGSTGWSTGPHLHFEMYVNGIPRDPLKIKLANGKPIPKNYLNAFHHRANTLLAELKLYHGHEFAMVDTRSTHD